MKDDDTITISLPAELKDILPKEEPLLLDWKTAKEIISNKAGLYAFWWHGPHGILNGDQEVEFTGPAFQKSNEKKHAFKRRFYWEDLLIGVLQLWFNLGGER